PFALSVRISVTRYGYAALSFSRASLRSFRGSFEGLNAETVSDEPPFDDELPGSAFDEPKSQAVTANADNTTTHLSFRSRMPFIRFTSTCTVRIPMLLFIRFDDLKREHDCEVSVPPRENLSRDSNRVVPMVLTVVSCHLDVEDNFGVSIDEHSKMCAVG